MCSDPRSPSDGHIAAHRLVAVTPRGQPNEQPHFDYFHSPPHHRLPSPLAGALPPFLTAVRGDGG